MSTLPSLLAEYADVVNGIQMLERRRDELRTAIEAEMSRGGLQDARHGSVRATLGHWFKLTPRREAILGLLKAPDLFPFAHFTAQRVKECLVPVYGRERLLPLFDYEKRSQLRVSTGRPSGAYQGEANDRS